MKWFLNILILVVIFGCKTQKIETVRDAYVSSSSTDTVIITMRDTTVVYRVPESNATITISQSGLNELPYKAGYVEKNGQATVSVQKTENGDYKVSANCDSLLFFLHEKESEITHLKSQNSELVEKTEKREVETIKEPSGFQWFQIWGFRVLSAVLILFITIKKMTLWQKLKSLLLRIFR
jgi:hypothetical protein